MVIVTKGINSINTKCHISLNSLFFIRTEYVQVSPKIKGQSRAKASRSHFAENSCEVYAPTSSITAISVTKQTTEPTIFERLVDVASKLFFTNSGNLVLKKLRTLFHIFLKNILSAFLSRNNNYTTFFQKNNLNFVGVLLYAKKLGLSH